MKHMQLSGIWVLFHVLMESLMYILQEVWAINTNPETLTPSSFLLTIYGSTLISSISLSKTLSGGLGNKHKLGVKVAEAVEPCKVLYYAKAMVDTFVEYGNYTNIFHILYYIINFP